MGDKTGQKFRKKPTIAELEKLLNSEEDYPIEILPNGEIRAVKKRRKSKTIKILTMREDLGGEYAMLEEKRRGE